MIKFPENGKLCIDSRLKGGLDLIANGSVTSDIWKFNVFVFLAKVPSYAPIPFNAFVAKCIHMYLKAISRNLKQNKSNKIIKAKISFAY